MNLISLKLESMNKVNSDEFHRFSRENIQLNLECTAQKELMLTPPSGGETGRQQAEILFQLMLWNKQTNLGVVFDSSTGFNLPNGLQRSPNVSWLRKAQWDSLTPEQKETFIPLCPDFVIELLSPTDSRKKAQENMIDYLSNGCSLGWLINRKKQEVEIYRPLQKVEIFRFSQNLSAEDILPGFTLNLSAFL